MPKNSKRILVVDDEVDIREILQFNLTAEGYHVEVASSAEEALGIIHDAHTPLSLILLDVMMGGISGYKMASQLRSEGNDVPIIFITAKNTENDLLTGFSVGADDYIKKPFSIREVVARVDSLLARTQGTTPSPATTNEPTHITAGPLTIDLQAMAIYLNGTYVDATKTEYNLLLLLASHPGRTFSRAEILQKVWHDTELVLERTVDVHIARLRKKIAPYGHIIVNRVGFGYTLRTEGATTPQQ